MLCLFILKTNAVHTCSDVHVCCLLLCFFRSASASEKPLLNRFWLRRAISGSADLFVVPQNGCLRKCVRTCLRISFLKYISRFYFNRSLMLSCNFFTNPFNITFFYVNFFFGLTKRKEEKKQEN